MIDPLYYQYFYLPFLEQRSLRKLATAAPSEQITLDEAKSHLRLDSYGGSPPSTHPDDTLLEQVYIPTARAICEALSGRSFVPQVYELGLAQFPVQTTYTRNGINLGIGPIRGVESVTYRDSSGTDVVLDPASYIVDPYTEPGFIYAIYGSSWPSAYVMPNTVRVRFTAGYDYAGGSPYDFPLPTQFKWAMLLALGHIYENREETTVAALHELPLGLQTLLSRNSLVNGFA